MMGITVVKEPDMRSIRIHLLPIRPGRDIFHIFGSLITSNLKNDEGTMFPSISIFVGFGFWNQDIGFFIQTV